jgi:transcriptional regulator with XRE-family HTH domain
MDVIRLGLSLRALRLRRRLTQAGLVALVGVSRATIARIERSHADQVTLRLLVRVAAELGASVNVRVFGTGRRSTVCSTPHTQISQTPFFDCFTIRAG